MSGRPTHIAAIGLGALFPALALAFAAAAPVTNDRFIKIIDAQVLSLVWWLMVPLGVVVSITRSRRLWPGAVVGGLAVLAFHLSMVLLEPAAGRAVAMFSPGLWLGAVVSVAVPWAIGMVFGWTSIHRHPLRSDGVPRDGVAASRR